MIDQYNLENLSKQLKIASLNIARENLEIEILNQFSQCNINQKIIFYGGTALRLAYGSPRYSEDLDFLMIKPIKINQIKKMLLEFIQKNPEGRVKDLKEKRNTLFALLNFKTSFLKHPLNIKIEIAKRKDGLKYEYIPLNSPCSHLKPILPIIKIESLEKLKIIAIKHRDEPKDWFDLWFIKKYLKKPFQLPRKFPFELKEFKRELKRFLPQNNWLLIDQIILK